MNETANQRGNGWKWAAVVLAVTTLILIFTCALSVLWSGAIGFAIGRRTARRAPSPDFGFDPYELPIPPTESMPLLPDEEGKAWLGVVFEMTTGGAAIAEVIVDSPADEAGIRVGDIITEVDGRNITENQPLDEIIEGYEPGDRIEVTLLRNGRERTVNVRLGSWREMLWREDRFEVPVMPEWEG